MSRRTAVPEVDLTNPDIPTAIKALGLTRRSRSEAREYFKRARVDAQERGASWEWLELFDALAAATVVALPEVGERRDT